MQIQQALKLMKETSGTQNPVVIQPIFMWSTVDVNGKHMKEKYFPNPSDFPDDPPCHVRSPLFNGQPMTIQQTFKELLKLQALDAVDGNGLKRYFE
jgi:hypothetical protein